jgi:hypothetical protein
MRHADLDAAIERSMICMYVWMISCIRQYFKTSMICMYVCMMYIYVNTSIRQYVSTC